MAKKNYLIILGCLLIIGLSGWKSSTFEGDKKVKKNRVKSYSPVIFTPVLGVEYSASADCKIKTYRNIPDSLKYETLGYCNLNAKTSNLNLLGNPFEKNFEKVLNCACQNGGEAIILSNYSDELISYTKPSNPVDINSPLPRAGSVGSTNTIVRFSYSAEVIRYLD
jgi:hypothetical protein